MADATQSSPKHSKLSLRAIGIMVLVVLVIVVGWILKTPSAKPDTTGKSSDKTITTTKNKSTTQKPSTTPSKATSNTDASSAAIRAATKNNPYSCDAVFTLVEGKKAIGQGEVTPENGNGITGQDANITTVTCTYNAQAINVTIIGHIARTTIGSSTNDVAFGSGRPGDTTPVSGYGSSAFWQTTTGLNILKNNNWYVAGSSNGDLATAKKVASSAGLAD
jgi:cytoskeletal protein RodZ